MIIKQAIPTTIVTGFLGAGKTTAIQSLLRRKSPGERWAILVNEFGEIGIDGALVAATLLDREELFIREVPGGCMCCAAGVPVRVALNQLIGKARPDRLLIEPTGLGHPREVIKGLLQPEYRGILELKAVVTLVDARKIADSRYTDHPVFQQQLEVADCIVANKQDLYTGNEMVLLREYLQEIGLDNTPLYATRQGEIDPVWLLETKHKPAIMAPTCHTREPPDEGLPAGEVSLPESGYLRKVRYQDGYYTGGWMFRADFRFDYGKVYRLLEGLDVERIKAVMITDKGATAFNQSDGVLTGVIVDVAADSRLELVSAGPLDWERLENDLMNCVTSGTDCD